MTAFEILSIVVSIIGLLGTNTLVVVAILSFLEKRKKKKK